MIRTPRANGDPVVYNSARMCLSRLSSSSSPRGWTDFPARWCFPRVRRLPSCGRADNPDINAAGRPKSEALPLRMVGVPAARAAAILIFPVQPEDHCPVEWRASKPDCLPASWPATNIQDADRTRPS
eukprot:gene15265-20671_t